MGQGCEKKDYFQLRPTIFLEEKRQKTTTVDIRGRVFSERCTCVNRPYSACRSFSQFAFRMSRMPVPKTGAQQYGAK
jgi:hypothetical protein